MVKQAEKKVKKNPLNPVFGIIIAAGLFLVSYLIAGALIAPGGLQVLATLRTGPRAGLYQLLIGGAIWFVLLAVAFFVVAVLVGRDPDDAVKKMPLPPRDVKKKK